MTKKFQLAELNFAKAKAPMDHPLLANFVAASNAVNAVADASPGFIWRYQPEGIDTFNIRPFEDQSIYITLSVWESVDALKNFVYKSMHSASLSRRKEWFEHLEPHLVMWWIPAGHIPTVEEAKERLEILKRNGPCSQAFDFKNPFSPPNS